jgi:hypothetical protein
MIDDFAGTVVFFVLRCTLTYTIKRKEIGIVLIWGGQQGHTDATGSSDGDTNQEKDAIGQHEQYFTTAAPCQDQTVSSIPNRSERHLFHLF